MLSLRNYVRPQLWIMLGLATAACTGSSDQPDLSHCFDDQPRPLAVVIDLSLPTPATFTYSCQGDAGWGDGACGAAPQPRASLDGDLNIFLRYEGLSGWWPVVEVDGSVGARVCGAWFSDVEPSDRGACDAPVCAVSGTVTLSRLPMAPSQDPISVVVDANYENGAELHAEFVVPDVQ